jgi:hypothetical protein
MKKSNYLPEILLAIHVLLGVAAASSGTLVFLWTITIFLLGFFWIITNRNNLIWAPVLAAYLCGIELLVRMSSSGLPHEFTKYAVILILLTAMFFEGKKLYWPFIMLGVLQIPGVLLANGGSYEATRQLISANFSGPACLAVAGLYFYKKPVSAKFIYYVFVALILPLTAIIGYLTINTPDWNDIEFGYGSNFETALYGPNQISSILGLGVMLIVVAFLIKLPLFKWKMTGFVVAGFFAFRGLLTFSRGGIFTILIVLCVVYLFWMYRTINSQQLIFRNIGIIVLLAISAYFMFDYANKLTKNALYDRYAGIKENKQLSIDQYSSGRSLIAVIDWQIFLDHPVFGIGMGMGKVTRPEYGYPMKVAAHIEFTRLLAEHGVFGLLVVLILLFAPLKRFSESKSVYDQILLLMGVGFCFVFMTHAATRIAAPMFVYALGFVTIVSNNKKAYKVDTLSREHPVSIRQVSIGN